MWTSKDPPTSLPHIPKKEKILNINKRNRELTAISFTDHFHLLFSFIFHASWKSSLYWGAVSTRKQALKILKAANCVNCWLLNIGWNIWFSLKRIKPHLHALKNRHGTPNFWHCADDFKARHSQFSTCKRIGPKCNVAPVLKILGVPRLPPGGSLGTGKRGTVPKIWRAVLIF